MARKRLDILLVEKGLAASREQAQAHILAGEVWAGETRLEKPGVKFDEELPLQVRSRSMPFVSRAGQKLQHALDAFGLDVRGRVCLDVGASTGGFTDCLLKRGAERVFAVDVGYGQIDSRLRSDSRVVVLEKVNARFLSAKELEARHADAVRIDFLCMDVSFISALKIVEPLSREFSRIRDWVLLFKPQFELGRDAIGKGGLVKDDADVERGLTDFDAVLRQLGFVRRAGPEASPLSGKKSGNVEYLIHYELTQVS